MLPSAAQALAESIAAKNCILFLGPDISESASGYRGVPTSWQLADELAVACAYRGPYLSLPRIAQVYERRFGRHALVETLRTRLLQPAYAPLPVHTLIAHMHFPYIIHAGWDFLLEQALTQRDVPYQRVQNARDLAYTTGSATTIYRPYGSLDTPTDGNLVITQKEQYDLFNRAQVLVGELGHVLARYSLLLAGYALDDDAVFMRIYHSVRSQQGEHGPPALAVLSVQRPDTAAYWETLGITPVVSDPAQFLYALAEEVARLQDNQFDVAGLRDLSQAEPVQPDDLKRHLALIADFMARLGIGPLVEQTDVPLLTPEQINNLEAMRTAYGRLAEGLDDPEGAADVFVRQGNIEYVRGNYDQAEAYYTRALQLDAALAEAYYNLHHALLCQHQQMTAVGEADAGEQGGAEKLAAAWTAYAEATRLDPALAVLPAHYRVDGVLGQGNTGIVYRAVDQRSGRQVAVKVIKRAFLYNQAAIQHFRREARLLQQIQHPHIVALVESGEHLGNLFIATEYLGDQTLAQHRRREGPLPFDEAIRIVSEIGQALAAAHAAGVIHRDVKPANIFLHHGAAKVIDFGLAVETAPAKAQQEAGSQRDSRAATLQSSATYGYQAPEQRAGQPVNQQTDQYALATIAYELIAGRHPDAGVYAPASEAATGVTPSLDIVLERARQADPSLRYATVAAFCRELESTARLQPASQHAPAWLRGLGRLQAGITWAAQRLWLGLMAASLLLLLLPARLVPQATTFIIAGRAAAFLLSVCTLNIVLSRLLLFSQARSTGYGLFAAYSSLWGLALGLIVPSALLIREFTAEESPQLVPSISWLTLSIVFLANLFMGAIFVLIAAAGTALGTAWARRTGRSLHWGPAAGLAITAIALAAFFALLREAN